MSSPAVTVIIPTHNHPGPLAFSIASVLQQSFEDLSLVVIGDGVGDDTGAGAGRPGAAVGRSGELRREPVTVSSCAVAAEGRSGGRSDHRVGWARREGGGRRGRSPRAAAAEHAAGRRTVESRGPKERAAASRLI